MLQTVNQFKYIKYMNEPRQIVTRQGKEQWNGETLERRVDVYICVCMCMYKEARII